MHRRPFEDRHLVLFCSIYINRKYASPSSIKICVSGKKIAKTILLNFSVDFFFFLNNTSYTRNTMLSKVGNYLLRSVEYNYAKKKKRINSTWRLFFWSTEIL